MPNMTSSKTRRRKARSRSSLEGIWGALFLASFLLIFTWLSRYSLQLEGTTLPQTRLLSRRDTVKISADVRGNLGPASVLNQDPPRADWIKDRWQAASDMHGTAIKGAHWILMEFPSPVKVSYIVVDWEAAFSKDYQIQVERNGNEWISIFDTNNDSYESHEFGQSPGVKTRTPLHIVHNVTVDAVAFTRLRLCIRSSAQGWGVSLWQVDVYGSEVK